ncbi:MAG: TMEM43 family protein [Deltaproteobacteria bacterium]|nr:TMEM43 family protein [Deltaproteobacteria bacterium]
MKRGRVRIGWFESVRSAVAGAIVGVLLFFGALAMLWLNEGRSNLAHLARQSVVASPETIDPALDHTLVSVTHETRSDAPLGDPEFLQPDRYLSLERRVEMLAWFESCPSRRRRCEYRTRWTATPPSSAGFQEPREHHNPAMRVRANRYVVDGSIGVYRFRTAHATTPTGELLALTPAMVRPEAPGTPTLRGTQMYLSERANERPAVGDLRLSFAAVRVGERSTFFAQQEGARLEPSLQPARMYRLLRGDREHAIKYLAREHLVIGWVLRVLGFVLLWLSLNLALGPLNAMLDVFEPLGRASRTLIALVTLPVAVVLSTAVIVLSALAHSPWWLVLGLFALLGVLLLARGTQRAR